MNPIIIPNVESCKGMIPSKAFLRKTKKFFIKISDQGITYTGITINWSEIKAVDLKTFNGNPYFLLNLADNSQISFFFEKKFYYRRKAPWFGASEFTSTEFAKILEEKNLFSVKKLLNTVEENKPNILIHNFWNTLFWIVPPFLIVISSFMMYLGFTAGS